MNREYRILILEDNPIDRELTLRELKGAELRFTHHFAETREQFVAALEAFRPDVVISDYSLPGFNGIAALEIVREKLPALPFIFVSGTVGEEFAVQALHQGAIDYMLKGHIRRLGQSVRRAIQEAEERQERKRLELQLVQAQKMEVVGQLAGGIAHDFNNMLSAILGFTELALTELGPGSPVRAWLEEVRNAGSRAASLTRQLLVFSRKQPVETRTIDLNQIILQMHKMLVRLIGEDIRLVTTPAEGLWKVQADIGHLEQVIMNLAVNARDAMPTGGTITIETQNVTVDETFARVHSGMEQGEHVMLAITDSGTGMSQEVLSHVFEPFFTTKEKGTGLGLSMVYGLVKQNRGTIWVYSEPGHGASFKIYLPRVEREAEPVPAPRPVRSSIPVGGTVLVVEDEPAVRRLVSRLLTNQKYTVLEAEDGAAGLALSERHAGPIDLLISDWVLPAIPGPELVGKVLSQRPGIKVLFMSGYTDRALTDQGSLQSGYEFLQKPFTSEALLSKVRDLLQRP